MVDVLKCFDFSSRRVLVTGGGQGIGRATVRAFAKLNATLLVVDKDADLLDDLKREIPSVQTIHLDISDWAAVATAIKPVLPIHHLINNAGVLGSETRLLSLEEEQFNYVNNVNVKGLLRVSQIVANGMINYKLKDATITNVSSVVSTVPIDGMLAYGATKAAIDHVTRTMALELAPYKIRVNAVRPGTVRTGMTHYSPEDAKKYLVPFFNAQVYHMDFIEPEAIARALVYLSSPMSEMTTAASLIVDAGYLTK